MASRGRRFDRLHQVSQWVMGNRPSSSFPNVTTFVSDIFRALATTAERHADFYRNLILAIKCSCRMRGYVTVRFVPPFFSQNIVRTMELVKRLTDSTDQL